MPEVEDAATGDAGKALMRALDPGDLVRIGGMDRYAASERPRRFQGQFQHPESGFQDNCFRFYDPDATQYLSPD